MKLLVIIALSLVVFGTAPVRAASDAEPPSEPPTKNSGMFLGTLERSHDTLSREIDLFSERIDLFLGGDRTCEISQDSYIQVGASTVLLTLPTKKNTAGIQYGNRPSMAKPRLP